jgi:hypothetical protein
VTEGTIDPQGQCDQAIGLFPDLVPLCKPLHPETDPPPFQCNTLYILVDGDSKQGFSVCDGALRLAKSGCLRLAFAFPRPVTVTVTVGGVTKTKTGCTVDLTFDYKRGEAIFIDATVVGCPDPVCFRGAISLTCGPCRTCPECSIAAQSFFHSVV